MVISKCGKSQNKVEVAEEIGCGNERKSFQNIGGKNELSFNQNKRRAIVFKYKSYGNCT